MILKTHLFPDELRQALKSLPSFLQKKSKSSESFVAGVFHTTRVLILLVGLALPFSLQSEGAFSKRTIYVRRDHRYIGESECAERFRIACQNLRWEAEILENIPQDAAQYDWIFTLTPEKQSLSNRRDGNKRKTYPKDYLIIFDPVHKYFTQTGHMLKKYLNYDGYLISFEPGETLLQDLKKKNVYPKRWYPTVHYRPYEKVSPNSLFYFLCTWGNRKDEEKYLRLLELLDVTKYANFYGALGVGKHYPNTYCGPVPFDGVTSLNLIADSGVCLVLHSDIHLKSGAPTGRIFEAAAASAVIISDLHPFVIENFGDSVLYVDQNLSGDEMFAEIEAHMKWIQKHPKKALKMAKRAHEIFEEKFLLEQQLLDFEQFIEACK